MTSGPVPAAAAGTWKLGDLTVNRMGFGARPRCLPGTGSPDHLDANVAAAALRLIREELARLQPL